MFDSYKILITSQAWWKVIHIVELLTVWKGFHWGFYVKIRADKLIHAHKFPKSQNLHLIAQVKNGRVLPHEEGFPSKGLSCELRKKDVSLSEVYPAL